MADKARRISRSATAISAGKRAKRRASSTRGRRAWTGPAPSSKRLRKHSEGAHFEVGADALASAVVSSAAAAERSAQARSKEPEAASRRPRRASRASSESSSSSPAAPPTGSRSPPPSVVCTRAAACRSAAVSSLAPFRRPSSEPTTQESFSGRSMPQRNNWACLKSAVSASCCGNCRATTDCRSRGLAELARRPKAFATDASGRGSKPLCMLSFTVSQMEPSKRFTSRIGCQLTTQAACHPSGGAGPAHSGSAAPASPGATEGGRLLGGGALPALGGGGTFPGGRPLGRAEGHAAAAASSCVTRSRSCGGSIAGEAPEAVELSSAPPASSPRGGDVPIPIGWSQ
mmetsp:Transcript_127936/g.409886  ORF Transcript_127936/g.409886 Transcript_127936/m.409886 type:complete len:345 (+) Transcript_127936:2243-3277(+)